jgi:hypothetical protein
MPERDRTAYTRRKRLMTEWVLNRIEWEAPEFTWRSLFSGLRGEAV